MRLKAKQEFTYYLGGVEPVTFAEGDEFDTASGAINMAIIIPLDDDLPVSLNIRPQIEAGGLTVNAE